MPPLKRTKSLQSVIARYEAKPAFAEHLKNARQELAKQAFGHRPQNLRALRLSAGLSQTQLAEKIGTVQSHVARIELGQTDPGTDLIVRIAKALGVEHASVFTAVRMGRDENRTEDDGE